MSQRATFKGIICALKEFRTLLINHDVKIFVRRGGPNYQEGLNAMRRLGESLGVEIKVYGPETHITEIVPLALGLTKSAGEGALKGTSPPTVSSPTVVTTTASSIADGVDQGAGVGAIHPDGERTQAEDQIVRFATGGHLASAWPWYHPFDAQTRAFVYGLQAARCRACWTLTTRAGAPRRLLRP